MTIEWLGHASFRIKARLTIYIDPWKLQGQPEMADLILISHGHCDHFSTADVAKIRDQHTRVAASQDVVRELGSEVTLLRPGDALDAGEVRVRATPAYNRDTDFHPKANDWLGFLIRLGGETIYFAGDTDVIPEMSRLGPVDTALLPVGGTYAMGPTQAAEAASIIGARRCIPYHYGDIVGSVEDARRFKRLCTCHAEILEPTE